jgi:Caspase domain/PDZ domain
MRLAILCLLSVLLPSVANAEARIALLIGNQRYSAKVGPLSNPHSDVLLVGAALKAVGFAVTEVNDADYRTTDAAIKRHIAAVRREGQGTISFVYYSGHGAADPDTKINYLIPVDVANADDEELWNYSINLNTLVENLRAQAPGATHYVVFDACRNELNLTRRGQKALTEKGFVPMAYTPGVLVAYATAPGRTASDTGTGGGTYAKALADEIMKPGVDSMLVFSRVARRVQHEIGQDPFLSASTMPEIYFAGNTSPAPSAPASRSELERAWEFIKETDDPSRLQEFIQKFGDTPYADMARARLEELKKKIAAATPTPSPGAQPQVTSPAPSGEGRGWLGVKIQNIDESIAERLGLVAHKGAVVTEVTRPGPAADLRTDDAVLSVDRHAVADSRGFARKIASYSPGAQVTLGIVRERKERLVVVKLGTFPSNYVPPPASSKTTLIGAFDGNWQIRWYDATGCSDRRASFSLTISNDAISSGGERPTTGGIDKAGNITFSRPVRTGATQRYVGRLNGNSGSGRFAGAGRCAGRFAATRQ